MLSNRLSNLLFYFSVFLVKLSLDLSYVFVMTDGFSYVGYSLDFSYQNYALSWALYFLSMLLLNPKLTCINDYFILTAVVSLLCPLLVIWGLDINRDFYPLFVSMFCVFLATKTAKLLQNYSVIKIPILKQGRQYSLLFSCIFVVYLFIWYPLSGVTYNIDFSKVYEYRSENYALSDPGILAYLNFWVFKVFSVFALAYFLLKKNYVMIFVMLFVFFSFYAANTHKSVLFTPLLIFGIWLYFSRNNKLYIFPMAMSLLIILSIFTYIFLDDIWLSALFPNRVFLIPAHLTFAYFDFFSSHDYLYYSNSFLSSYVYYPYEKGLSYVMGDFIGSPGTAANNGYVSSGFAQGGAVVPIIYSILIGILISLIDRAIISNLIPAWFALALFVVPMRDFLISMDLLTAILTGGMFWSLVLIYLSRQREI